MGRVPISPQELGELMKREPVVLIDTRDATSYGEAHIHGAVNIHECLHLLSNVHARRSSGSARRVREGIRPSWPFGRERRPSSTSSR